MHKRNEQVFFRKDKKNCRYMKRFSISLITIEIQIKTILTYHSPYWQKFKSLIILSIHKDTKQLEIASICSGSINWSN